MKVIRVHAHGGPRSCEVEEAEVPHAGPGQALLRIEAVGVNFVEIYHRTGLYKIPRPLHARHRSGRYGRGRRAGSDDRPAWRPRRLRQRARRLRRVRARPGGSAGAAARPGEHPAGRCRAAPGRDRPVPHHLDFSARAGADLPGARRCRRRRPAALPDGQAPRRPGDRHCLHRGEGGAGARGRRRRRDPVHPDGLRDRGEAAHGRRRASTWSTIRSGAPRSPRDSTAWFLAA